MHACDDCTIVSRVFWKTASSHQCKYNRTFISHTFRAVLGDLRADQTDWLLKRAGEAREREQKLEMWVPGFARSRSMFC